MFTIYVILEKDLNLVPNASMKWINMKIRSDKLQRTVVRGMVNRDRRVSRRSQRPRWTGNNDRRMFEQGCLQKQDPGASVSGFCCRVRIPTHAGRVRGLGNEETIVAADRGNLLLNTRLRSSNFRSSVTAPSKACYNHYKEKY